MSYRPLAVTRFGPPWGAHLFPLIYAVVAVAVCLTVWIGSLAPAGSWLFRYVVEQDARRVLGARPFAALLLVSSVAALFRTRMSGVIVYSDGLETRDLSTGGLPRVRKYAWPQIDRILLQSGVSIGLELWDGRREWLPVVGKREELASLLEHVARARAIPTSGELHEFVYDEEPADAEAPHEPDR